MAVAVSAYEPAAPESPEQRTFEDARLLLKSRLLRRSLDRLSAGAAAAA